MGPVYKKEEKSQNVLSCVALFVRLFLDLHIFLIILGHVLVVFFHNSLL